MRHVKGVACDLMGEACAHGKRQILWENHALPNVPEATRHPMFGCATNEPLTNLVRESPN